MDGTETDSGSPPAVNDSPGVGSGRVRSFAATPIDPAATTLLSTLDLMTSHSPFDDDITTADEFETALGNLLLGALENGVDPRGAWEFRTNGTPPDWEVMVVELQARDSTD